jgi:hypothetical protein
MGTGHVKFFYNKLGWVTKRFNALREELLNRGYEPTIVDPDKPWRELIPTEQWGDWQPMWVEVKRNLTRLVERSPTFYAPQRTRILRKFYGS